MRRKEKFQPIKHLAIYITLWLYTSTGNRTWCIWKKSSWKL